MIVIGIGLMLAAGFERWLHGKPVPVPLFYIAVGVFLPSLPLGIPNIDVLGDDTHSMIVELSTEFIVIASLMAAGIAIDRKLTWANWRQATMLIFIAMPLTIVAIATLGWAWLGLAPATAILLGAALAPTDPVLAKSVSVGPPGIAERDDVRFDLTVESGLNDGLAFPFTYLAIAAVGMTGLGGWTFDWFLMDGLWRMFAGTVVGIAVGIGGAIFVFRVLPEGDTAEDDSAHHSETREGLVVLGTLLLAYGLAEAVEGYGFIAVFVGAVAAKQYDRRRHYHRLSHHFIDQIEEIILVAMLIGFGMLLASGILDALTWQGAAFGLLLLFVIRPISGVLAELGCALPWPGKLAVGFLGVRGMGTIYYLSYAQNHAEFSGMDEVWAIACFTILASIIVHGLSAAPIMARLSRDGHHIHPGQGTHVMEADVMVANVVGEAGPED